ncbi:hypothetical protein Tco_0694702, partial [Tanacetum coccineum]
LVDEFMEALSGIGCAL